ncbi:MAG: DEAD/DEAH box helicase [Candidatus Ancillula sp.]|jgi:transcription-repair coupling factor (superfamily II helicase)|nr:DEAD/DEAH box helicase [Candidatus Ancillula sp.]
MTPLEILNQIEVSDERYFDQVLEIANIQHYSPNQIRVLKRPMRSVFLLSLLKFKRVYIMRGVDSLRIDNVSLSLDKTRSLTLYTEVSYPRDPLLLQLVDLGYIRTEHVNFEGEFTVHGDSIDIFGFGEDNPCTLDFFDDELESIFSYNLHSRARLKKIDKQIIDMNPEVLSTSGDSPPAQTVAHTVAQTVDKIAKESACVLILDPELIPESLDDEYISMLKLLKKSDVPTIAITAFGDVSNEILTQEEVLLEKFTDHIMNTQLGVALTSYLDYTTKSARVQEAESKSNAKPVRPPLKVDDLEIGDYLVHDLHGIGKYVGKQMRENHFEKAFDGSGLVEEYLVIEYASSSRKKNAPPDHLFVAASDPQNLALYIGASTPRLSRFGGGDFAKSKAKVKRYTNDVAKELIKIYAGRMRTRGIRYLEDDAWMRELEHSFPYELTPDQATAIEAVKEDMESEHPMDRLVCADVGFGKTEVALRAALKAISTGKQVALLVPTTILASQHFETFSSRYDNFPIGVKMLNRFVTAKERAQIYKDVENGKIDLLIGTHALLTPKVRFKDLGLVIIDEEQRFGAMHKEMLKMQNLGIDVLAMSATPIPRTLEMALTGVRDISTIATPPENRRSIITNVLEHSDTLVVDAILSEVRRGGQVFVIHNNTKTISNRCQKLSNLVPEARFAYAHGQMVEGRIDRIIDDYWRGKIDVLVCTTIVETGLDIPNASTLIVENAQNFGLTGLHQLRGRIGRSSTQSYAYFFYQPGRTLTENAYKRLETIQDLSELGAGTAIALKDLEMRGAGNFLGAEQSGYIAGVGYDMYIRLMQEAIERFKELSQATP